MSNRGMMSGVAALLLAVVMCGFASAGTTATQLNETPAPAESNPPGDIPDTQVFVAYRSPSGYQIDVPEGWARSTQANLVTFADKYDGVRVEVWPVHAQGSTRQAETRAMDRIPGFARVVRDLHASSQVISGRSVLRIDFSSNSPPNPVTGRSIRLENSSYIFQRLGKEAMLTLWAPLGSDNVDQWKQVAASFRWH